jgi:hypothetical protein
MELDQLDADDLRLHLVDLTATQEAKLKEVLTEQVQGFRAVFAA